MQMIDDELIVEQMRSRLAGLKRAIKEAEDAGLKVSFETYKTESSLYGIMPVTIPIPPAKWTVKIMRSYE